MVLESWLKTCVQFSSAPAHVGQLIQVLTPQPESPEDTVWHVSALQQALAAAPTPLSVLSAAARESCPSRRWLLEDVTAECAEVGGTSLYKGFPATAGCSARLHGRTSAYFISFCCQGTAPIWSSSEKPS